MGSLETYFSRFRKHIVGVDASFRSPYGIRKLIYTDWIASGRLYGPIEEKILSSFGPFVGNTHTGTSETGSRMTSCYNYAHNIIKEHVHAGQDDVIITAGSGMTSVVNKLQRILGLKGCGMLLHRQCLREVDKPVVFVTHMEHHSNHTSWYETIADVVVLQPDRNLLVDPGELCRQLDRYSGRKFKIGAFTAGSNVTGIIPPYHELAKIMHEYGGIAFVDFAAVAPYVTIDMHPPDPMQKLDAVYFSPHKFLGGPGSSGVIVFDSKLYRSTVPDDPGGGTVDWTNPWGEYKYIDDIEMREDGGTPGFIQAIRGALAVRLKEEMGVEKIRQREHELLQLAMNELEQIPSIRILAINAREKLRILSFYHPEIHYNLFVKLLSDRFGIQMRGGCVCAGTYGHYLLEVSCEKSKEITDRITSGDLSTKPGWVRMSLHPVNTDEEVHYIMHAIREIVNHYRSWASDYHYNRRTNEFTHRSFRQDGFLKEWFTL